MKWLVLLVLISCSSSKNSSKESKKDLGSYLKSHKIYEPTLSSEGEYVMVFNPKIVPFVKNKLTKVELTKLKALIAPALKIELSANNFTQAAERFLDETKDETNYDAVWVRDSAWIYFALIKNDEKVKAYKLITALWDYYATDDQWERFINIIKNPEQANESKMAVPHIRFNGNDPDYKDVYINGKPQEWNHRQNDAHGLFLLALADAISEEIIQQKDFTSERKRILSLFPSYFDKINFSQFKGAGAWEEIDKVNTSSIAMVVKSLESWRKLLQTNADVKANVSWSSSQLSSLIRDGYRTIEKQLFLGGESPNGSPYDMSFRKEDAALFNLFLPVPLEKLSREQKRYGLAILEKLVRPFGVIRYKNDSYQGGNYWIKPKDNKAPELTGDASSNDSFLTRFKNLIPHTEAQWFFDSKLALIHIQNYQSTLDPVLKDQSKFLAMLHFKRALGQLTGKFDAKEILAADGKPVRDLQVPESINTVILNGKHYYLPSPITPLNWAKASLQLALLELEGILE